jgi:hypothetical protein
MLPKLRTLSRDFALAAKSVPVGRMYPLRRLDPDTVRVSKLLLLDMRDSELALLISDRREEG